MRSGFNYGLLGTAIAMAVLAIGVETTLWLSRRAERRAGNGKLDVDERLSRAEAAIREAEQEIASVRAELASHR